MRKLLPFVLLISVIMLAGCPKKPADVQGPQDPSPDPKWEVVSASDFGLGGRLVTSRMRAPGGWVYRTYENYNHQTSMCYVPDPSVTTAER